MGIMKHLQLNSKLWTDQLKSKHWTDHMVLQITSYGQKRVNLFFQAD